METGVGGYKLPNSGGHSLRMWKSYFSKGNMFSMDVYNKLALQEKRIKIFQVRQVDITILNQVLASMNGEPDLIIDNGSHIN